MFSHVRPLVSFALATAIIVVTVRFTPLRVAEVVVASLPLALAAIGAGYPSQWKPAAHLTCPFALGMWAGACGLRVGAAAAIGLAVAYGLMGLEIGSFVERHRRRHIRGRVLCRDCDTPIQMLSFIPYVELLYQHCPECKRRRQATRNGD